MSSALSSSDQLNTELPFFYKKNCIYFTLDTHVISHIRYICIRHLLYVRYQQSCPSLLFKGTYLGETKSIWISTSSSLIHRMIHFMSHTDTSFLTHTGFVRRNYWCYFGTAIHCLFLASAFITSFSSLLFGIQPKITDVRQSASWMITHIYSKLKNIGLLSTEIKPAATH